MSKTFIYEVEGKREGEYEEIFCEVEYSRLLDATVEIIMKDYFDNMSVDENTYNEIKVRIGELVFSKDMHNSFDEELKDYFEADCCGENL